MTRIIPVSSIEIPKNWRAVKKKTVGELVLSYRQDGLLQPIGVRPGLQPNTYILVFGRHRLEAAKKSNWTEISANVLEIDEIAASSATNAENLFRNSLSPGERIVALKSWSERYKAEHPEVHGRGTAGGTALKARREAEKTGAGLAESPKPFAAHVEEQTGIAKKTVQNYVGAASKLTDEQVGVMAERGVPMTHIKTINSLPEDSRGKAVALIASGLGATEAISQATLPPNATVEKVGDPSEASRAEVDMTDDEWLETYCGEVLARLKYKAAYKRDATLYRTIRDATHKFKGSVKKALSQSKAQIVGPYFLLVARFVNTEHPSRWLPCGPCGGSGQSGDKSKCGFCRGHGFSINK